MGKIRLGVTMDECAERCYSNLRCMSFDYVHKTSKYVFRGRNTKLRII